MNLKIWHFCPHCRSENFMYKVDFAISYVLNYCKDCKKCFDNFSNIPPSTS